jgi:hypothetical protein
MISYAIESSFLDSNKLNLYSNGNAGTFFSHKNYRSFSVTKEVLSSQSRQNAFSPIVRIGTTRRRVFPPLWSRGGGYSKHSLVGEEVGEGPNSDERTDTVAF